MRIEFIICPAHIEEKLQVKHSVTAYEAEQVLISKHRIRFLEKGLTKGEDLYSALGKTFAGRYLAVFFVYKPESKTAIIISARNMSKRERKSYGRK